LRGLKAFGFADDDVAYVSGYGGGRTTAINIVVTTGLKSFHERSLAAVAESDDGQGGVLGIGANQASDIEGSQFAHVRRANDGGRRIVFNSGERERWLRAAVDLEALSFQRVAETLREIDIGVDE